MEWQDEDPVCLAAQIEMPRDLVAITKVKPLSYTDLKPRLPSLPTPTTRRQWDLLLATSRLAAGSPRFILPAHVDDYLSDRGECAPFLLAAWDKHDGITTCFDDLAQSINEAEYYPTWIGAFQLNDPQGARKVFHHVRKFITWQTAMDQLLGVMNAE